MTDNATVIGEATPASFPDLAAPITQRRLLGLAIPIIGESPLQTGLCVVDTVIVAALGESALAGVGIASEVVFFLISIISAFSVAGTVVVSHAIGARDREGANRLARQTVAWGLVVIAPLSVVTWVLTPALIDIFGATPMVSHLSSHQCCGSRGAAAHLRLRGRAASGRR